MSKTNLPAWGAHSAPQWAQFQNGQTPRTAQGAPASILTPYQQLRRTVLACMLFESTFYEAGQTAADRIRALVGKCTAAEVSQLAVQARTEYKVRHVSLLLARELARNHKGEVVGRTITRVIQRADEIAEFVAIYWKDGKCPLSKQVKLGLQGAFRKFTEYQFGKYDRDTAIKLRDVLFLVHAKPKDSLADTLGKLTKAERHAGVRRPMSAGEQLYQAIAERTLATPDTWEVALSAGADKKETFERLLHERKLGYMALLRNLRNMEQAGVDRLLVQQSLIDGAEKSKALPFRFVAAMRAAPSFTTTLEQAMMAAVAKLPRLQGVTNLLVDVSGSMGAKLSDKSDLTRLDAAMALAVLLRGVGVKVNVFTFSNHVVQIGDEHAGMALMLAIDKSQDHGGTQMGQAIEAVRRAVPADRTIVLTDEQSADMVGVAGTRLAYMINVANYKNGVGYDAWTKIDGFSEATVQYIQELEAFQAQMASLAV